MRGKIGEGENSESRNEENQGQKNRRRKVRRKEKRNERVSRREREGKTETKNRGGCEGAESVCFIQRENENEEKRERFKPQADPGGPGGLGPSCPQDFKKKSCSFKAILREHPLF